MNETFARILEFTLIFWILISLLSTVFAERLNTYIVEDSAISTINAEVKDIGLLSGISILFDVMTFQITESIPVWVSAILDTIFILTGISLIMALTNR